MKKFLKKAIGFVISVYFFIILFPYIMTAFFYGVFKYFAEDGSRLDVQLGILENEILNVLINVGKNIDLNFVFLNLTGMVVLMIAIAILRKHKILIPRKLKVEIEVPNNH